jgi:hypothetical protein
VFDWSFRQVRLFGSLTGPFFSPHGYAAVAQRKSRRLRLESTISEVAPILPVAGKGSKRRCPPIRSQGHGSDGKRAPG